MRWRERPRVYLESAGYATEKERRQGNAAENFSLTPQAQEIIFAFSLPFLFTSLKIKMTEVTSGGVPAENPFSLPQEESIAPEPRHWEFDEWVETKIQLDYFTRILPFLLKVFEINDA